MGRNYKFGEPTVKREFRIPESLSESLTRVARERDSNLSDVLVAALRRELSEEVTEKGEELSPAVVAEIRSTVFEAVREALQSQRSSDSSFTESELELIAIAARRGPVAEAEQRKEIEDAKRRLNQRDKAA